MRVRCPNCHNPLELTDDSEFSEIECPSCGSSFSLLGEQTATFQKEEARTIGHFKLLEQVGIGAFGAVWRARDTQLDRTVAVKLPRKGQLDPSESEQFLREAGSAAQLKHPNIVGVHEVGRVDDQVFIVSDFVEGLPLSSWLTGRQPTFREAAELCAKMAEALHHAHERGVIHRDLKPSNIMLDAEGEPHIMDFGLVKREAGEVTMTMDGKVLGTPAYMSPEQAMGKAHTADRRTDVYSLGVILFELLTGEKLFRGDYRMLLHQVVNEDAPSPRRLKSSVPRDLETICLKCLDKEAHRRYQTAEQLQFDLGLFLCGAPTVARPIGRLARAWRWVKRKPALASLWAAAIALLLTFGLGGLFIVSLQVTYTAQISVEKARRAIAQVDALSSAAPEGVPYLIVDLNGSEELVIPPFRSIFEDPTAPPTHRLRAAFALANLDASGEDVVDYIIDNLGSVSDRESGNVIAALRRYRDRDRVLSALRDARREADDPRLEVRIASTCWHLGDSSLVEEMLESVMPSSGFTKANHSPAASEHWRSVNCWDNSSMSATPSSTRIAAASFIGISSRAT